MSKATGLDIDVNVNLNVSYDTAQTCLRILNTFLSNNPDYKLCESVGASDGKGTVYVYDIAIPF